MAGISEVSRLVQASADGSETAWAELVRRYSSLVMAVTRGYQLTAADAQDVSQTVWMRLVGQLMPPRPAVVTLMSTAGPQATAQADEAGCFTFPPPAPGSLRLGCSLGADHFITDWVTVETAIAERLRRLA